MQIHFATTNQGKIQEAQQLLNKYGIDVVSVSFSSPEGTTGTVTEIARQKLQPLIDQGYQQVMVEDSGIFLEAYAGFPGVLSKRVFEGIGYKGFEKLLQNETRKAWFEGAIAIYWHGEVQVFTASMEGEILQCFPRSLQAEPGLPFDAIFCVSGERLPLQQLSADKRYHYSYRRLALEEMVHWLHTRPEQIG